MSLWTAFWHDSCKARIAELRDRLLTAEQDVESLKMRHKELLDRFLTYEGREKKLAARDRKAQEPNDEVTPDAPLAPARPVRHVAQEMREAPSSAHLATRFKGA